MGKKFSRVLIIGGSAGPGKMERDVVLSLEEMGFSVSFVGTYEFDHVPKRLQGLAYAVTHRLLREPQRLHESKILRAVEDNKPDLILVLLGNLISPKTVEQIRRRTTVPVVCWCQDSLSTMGRQYLLGSKYDKVFVKDRHMLDGFQKMLGMDVHFVAEACAPAIHRRVTVSPAERADFGADICVYGSIYYYRQAILEQLGDYDMKVWGVVPPWLIRRLKPGVLQDRIIIDDDKCKAISASKVSLNTMHIAEIRGLNARTFEVAGCGGFQLISESPAVAENFEIGKEIETFGDVAELKDKLDYYLAHDEEREQIAAAGQARAYRDHTYAQRVREIIRVTSEDVSSRAPSAG